MPVAASRARFAGLTVTGTLAALALFAAVLVVPAGAQGARPVDIDLAPGGGWWVTYSDGRIEARDHAPGIGSVKLGERVRLVALVPASTGYWAVTNWGHVVSLRGASSSGDVSHLALNGEIIAAVPTTTGRGYYLLGSDGGIFTFGDARFHGSVQGMLDERHGPGQVLANDWLTAPVVTMATTPAGYWLVSADGSVFSFGDAVYHGSVQDVVDEQAGPATAARDWLNSPIVGVVPSAAGAGYLMLASDGGIFNFGRSQFHGSIAGQTASPAVAVDVTANRSGYVIVTADGRVWVRGTVARGESTACRQMESSLAKLDELLERVKESAAYQVAIARQSAERSRPEVSTEFGKRLAENVNAALNSQIEYAEKRAQDAITRQEQSNADQRKFLWATYGPACWGVCEYWEQARGVLARLREELRAAEARHASVGRDTAGQSAVDVARARMEAGEEVSRIQSDIEFQWSYMGSVNAHGATAGTSSSC